MRLRLLVPLLILLPGCNLLGPRGGELDLAHAPKTLAEARARWEAGGPEQYRFHFSRLCFCAPRVLEATVYVRADTVYAVEELRGDDKPIQMSDYDWLEDAFVSVEQLFDLIEQADPDFREVDYDARLGYPRRAVLGNFAVDAGIDYGVRDVVPLD